MSLRLSRLILLFALLAGALLLAGCRGSHGHSSLMVVRNPFVSLRATVTIPRGQMLFSPYILVIRPGTRVTWQNEDTVVHTIVTTLSSKAFLNPQVVRLSVPPGKSIAFAFTKPGLYNYFDPTQADWNGLDQRVAAHKGVPNYPLAMEGIIWVQGPLGGLSSAVTNTIPGRDDFSQDFTALPKGGTITWQNTDKDTHAIAWVPGWQAPINPVNPGPLEIKGTDAQPGGGSAKLTLTTPGLYYYYCPTHASVNPTWKRAQADKDASEAPIPMEGFLLVTEHP
jgi:plastocyanin